MKLVPNAKKIALRSYSMWANYLGILSLLAPEAIYLFTGRDTDPRLWWLLGLALIVSGIIGRILYQGIDTSKLRSPIAVMLIAMSMVPTPSNVAEAGGPDYSITDFDAVAVPLIAKWEGLRTTAYQDIVGVWTVCYGETKGVRPGDRYTEAQCKAMLAREVRSYRSGLHAYFTPETIDNRLTASRDAAYTSLAYNAGVYAIGRSTATRRLNAGDIAGGCDALAWWNRAGGRVVRGLVNRRAEEVRLCRAGLS